MCKNDPTSVTLSPGETVILIGQDLNTRLLVHHDGDDTELVSEAIILTTALTVAINNDDDLVHQIVDRFVGRMEQATGGTTNHD